MKNLSVKDLVVKNVVRMACVGIVVFALSSQCFAQDAASNPADTTIFDQCLDKANGVTSEMQGCMTREEERLDRILNAKYKSIMNMKISKAEKEEVRNAQRAWLDYRDKTIKVAGNYVGSGSMYRTLYHAFCLDMLRNQALVLHKIAISIQEYKENE